MDNESLDRIRFVTGKGGVNKLFFGYGYSLTSALSVGIDVNYFFGNIQTSAMEYISGVQFGTRELNTSSVSGFSTNLGLMFNKKIAKENSLFSSITYSPESKFNITNTTKIGTVSFVDPLNPSDIDFEEATNISRTLINPSKLSVGLGYGNTKKFGVGTQLTFTENTNFANRFDDINNVTFTNGTKLGVGGFYIPKILSFGNYWNRVTYRAGMTYETTGMVINNQDLKEYGINFGLGLPMTGTFSNINIGFEYGSRGTKKANLIQENYLNVLISLSLSDKWFVKSKYN